MSSWQKTLILPLPLKNNYKKQYTVLSYFGVFIIIIIIIIINILTAIGLAPVGSSPVHIYREHYIEYTNNTQNT